MLLLLHYFTVGNETVRDRDAPLLRNCRSSEAMQDKNLILADFEATYLFNPNMHNDADIKS